MVNAMEQVMPRLSLQLAKLAAVVPANCNELTTYFCDDLTGMLLPVQGSCVVHVWHMH